MGVDEERAREHPRKERNAREKERDSICTGEMKEKIRIGGEKENESNERK